MRIFAKTATGKRFEIPACGTDTVDTVRQKIVDALPGRDTSASQVQLHYLEKVVDIGQLNDYGIQDGDELRVVITKQQHIEVTVTYERKRITQHVDPSETVESLKRMLSPETGVSPVEMKLLFQQKEIAGGRLSHYGVCHGAVLVLQVVVSQIQITVKEQSGKKEMIEIYASDKVEVLHGKVEVKFGVKADQQRLLFGGKQLENGRTLNSYGIGQGSIIQLVLRLRGGHGLTSRRI